MPLHSFQKHSLTLFSTIPVWTVCLLSASGLLAQTSGPIAAYSFNEGSGLIAADASGNGNTGQINGATWTTAGKYGAALSFSGTSYVDIGSSPAFKTAGSMTW